MAEPERFAVARLDEIEPFPGPGTLVWHPVRAHLGIRAFGTNAYTAEEAGVDVVEPHDEDDQQELYLVFRGAARFTLDGETFDAPDPAAAMDAADLKDRVADAIARLPEREKLVVALYYYENLTLREIGEVLGVTESRVSQLHTKAVMRLKSHLQQG